MIFKKKKGGGMEILNFLYLLSIINKNVFWKLFIFLIFVEKFFGFTYD